MANITDGFRKPAMTDETGIAIAEKLGGDTSSEYKINTSAEYRKPPMSDETAQLILAKISGGSGGASNLSDLDDVILTSPSDGQVLHYDGSEWINATPVNELPAVTGSDNGSVLKVVEGVWAKGSETVELPAVTSDDNGKMLSVVNGVWNKDDNPMKDMVIVKAIGGGKASLNGHQIQALLESGKKIMFALSSGGFANYVGGGGFDGEENAFFTWVGADISGAGQVATLKGFVTKIDYQANITETKYDIVNA